MGCKVLIPFFALAVCLAQAQFVQVPVIPVYPEVPVYPVYPEVPVVPVVPVQPVQTIQQVGIVTHGTQQSVCPVCDSRQLQACQAAYGPCTSCVAQFDSARNILTYCVRTHN